ncbi:hypothetical protein I3842_15G110900 [Carya illinoinensis]|uniref:Oleosin n=1 Tax=Carya illinoinensis TaxID=32201 RepID=A0A922A7Z2_CARIL|nr:hypothetical protein I3842_15G110900 [Carya illinoinensis]
MADRQPSSVQTQRGAPKPNSAFLRKLQDHAPNSSQLIGFLTLLISGSVLLIFTGLTVTVTALCFIFFAPLILISSPIWLPIGTILFFCIAGFLSLCGFGVAVIAALSWMYRYFRGLNPPVRTDSTTRGAGSMTLPAMSRTMLASTVGMPRMRLQGPEILRGPG